MTDMALGSMCPQDLLEMEEILMPYFQAMNDSLQDSWPSLDSELLLLHYLCLRLDLRPPTWWPAHVKRPIISCMSRPTWEHGMSLMAASGEWTCTQERTRRWNPQADRNGKVRGSALPCAGIGLHDEQKYAIEGARSVACKESAEVAPPKALSARALPDFSEPHKGPDEQRMLTTTPSTCYESRPDSRLSSAIDRPESSLSNVDDGKWSFDTSPTSAKKACYKNQKALLSDDRWKTHIPQSWPRCGSSRRHHDLQRPKSATTSTASRIGNRQNTAGQPSDNLMLRFQSGTTA